MKLLSPPNPTLLALAALAAVLLFPLAASAQGGTPAPRTVASQICDFASNLPADLQAEIEDLMDTAGFIGLPADQCPQFVNSLVKSCLSMVRAGTACFVNVNATVGLDAGRMTELGCATQPDRESQKSCRSTARSNTRSNASTASQTVQQLAVRACNENFAAAMTSLCVDGTIAP